MAKEHQLSTKGVRAGTLRSEFQEHSEALYLTSSFVFDNAEQAATRFAGTEEGMVYSRYTNPTVSMFQDAPRGARRRRELRRHRLRHGGDPRLGRWCT